MLAIYVQNFMLAFVPLAILGVITLRVWDRIDARREATAEAVLRTERAEAEQRMAARLAREREALQVRRRERKRKKRRVAAETRRREAACRATAAAQCGEAAERLARAEAEAARLRAELGL